MHVSRSWQSYTAKRSPVDFFMVATWRARQRRRPERGKQAAGEEDDFSWVLLLAASCVLYSIA